MPTTAEPNTKFPRIRRIRIPKENVDPELWRKVIFYHLIYSIVGLVGGALLVVVGALLFYFGTEGGTTWIVNALGMKSTLTDGPPGAVIAIVGFLVVAKTHFDVQPEK